MNKIIKHTLQGIVAAAIISGTYFGRGKDDFPPLYSHKTRDAYGINVAVYTKVDSGASINGLNLSLFNGNLGKINGVNASFGSIESCNGQINGLELGLFNSGKNFDSDSGCDVNGLAIGVVNFYRNLNGAQIGLYNKTKDNAGVLLNVDFYNGGK